MRSLLVALLVVVFGASRAHAQQCQQRNEPKPLALRFVTQQPPKLGPKVTLWDIALNTEYTMRNNCTGSCAYAAVRNADLIKQYLGRDAKIYVTIERPWRGDGAHATGSLYGLQLNRGGLNTLDEVLGEWQPKGQVLLEMSRDDYVAWELAQNGRNVVRVPLGSRVWNNIFAGETMVAGGAGGFLVGTAVDQVASRYDVDPAIRIGLVQTGGYLGSVGGSAGAARLIGYATNTSKLPVGTVGSGAAGVTLGGATAGLGVYTTMWTDVIEPESTNALDQQAKADCMKAPNFAFVSDGGRNHRREAAERAAEAEYFACISRWFGLGIFFCSYPAHWKTTK